MFHREMEEELAGLSKDYPVVTVHGPRQSGKTTLVQKVFPEKPYANLEAPDVREFAQRDPRGFLDQYPDGAILDEIQRVPSLLSYIQVIVDESARKGMFILTGSQQLELQQAISQSLAGRTALLSLLPMSLPELEKAGFAMSLDEQIVMGGYPRIFKDKLDPNKAYRSYFQTYIERDVRQLAQIKDLVQFQRFVRLCAGRVGQLLNLESLGGDVGVSSHTVKHWLSILEASFILIRLQPYYENFGKRMIKSPKLYFTDVGLACYLLGIENTSQLSRDPLRGNLVENFVLMELIKFRSNQGLEPRLYFFRDAHGHEVDIVFQVGHELVPIEVKASKTYTKDYLKGLLYFKELLGPRCLKGFMIYGGTLEQTVNDFRLLNYRNASQALEAQ